VNGLGKISGVQKNGKKTGILDRKQEFNRELLTYIYPRTVFAVMLTVD